MIDYEEMQRMLERSSIAFALDPTPETDNIKVNGVIIRFTNDGTLCDIEAVK